MAETVMVILTKVTTMNIKDLNKGAILDPSRSKALLTILPNDSPHGIVGWHINSSSVKVNEPEGLCNMYRILKNKISGSHLECV